MLVLWHQSDVWRATKHLIFGPFCLTIGGHGKITAITKYRCLVSVVCCVVHPPSGKLPSRDSSNATMRSRVFLSGTLPNFPSLRWRHNGHDCVSNHQPRHCLFSRISKKTSKLRVAGLCAGNSPGTGEFTGDLMVSNLPSTRVMQ